MTTITMTFEGYIAKIIKEALRRGLVKTKAEALRLGLLELNDKYRLVPRKLSKAEEERLEARLAEKIMQRVREGKEKLHGEKELWKVLRE